MKKLLLHICCAPCAIYPLEYLNSTDLIVTGLFYNPNIHPQDELDLRLENVYKLSNIYNFDCIFDESSKQQLYEKFIKNNSIYRCEFCYDLRLEYSFRYAKEHGYNFITTTLLYSIYQNHDLLIKICEKLALKYEVNFYYVDFRKEFRYGQQKAKDLGIYCQKYCGCIISLKERIAEISKNFKENKL